MRFVGLFQHGRCYGVAATDGEAHALVELHPSVTVEEVRARTGCDFHVGLTPG